MYGKDSHEATIALITERRYLIPGTDSETERSYWVQDTRKNIEMIAEAMASNDEAAEPGVGGVHMVVAYLPLDEVEIVYNFSGDRELGATKDVYDMSDPIERLGEIEPCYRYCPGFMLRNGFVETLPLIDGVIPVAAAQLPEYYLDK